MEMLDIVDEHGEPTGKTVERAVAHREGIMHRTAHVWLLRKNGGTLQVLLQKRCLTKDSFPGCYDISSAGHVPAGYGYVESALRELKEELGITVRPEELIFCGDRTSARDDFFNGEPFKNRQYSRVFCVWNDTPEEGFKLQKEEVDSVMWMDFVDCLKAVKENTVKNCICPEELKTVLTAIGEKI